ncbi:hypothetical protein EAF04_004980 [Stromatinia cepivora]|nr:hypothetical protein EAF04_004980 [Stromatinia cepivora]
MEAVSNYSSLPSLLWCASTQQTESMLLDGMEQSNLRHDTDAGFFLKAVEPKYSHKRQSIENSRDENNDAELCSTDNDSEEDTEDEDSMALSVERHIELLGWKKSEPTSIFKLGNIANPASIPKQASKSSDERSLLHAARDRGKVVRARVRRLELLEKQSRRRNLIGRHNPAC